MTLDELSYDQRFELKQKYQCEFWEEDPSYEEVANADRYVTDKQLEEAYSGIDFTDGDFSCTSNPVEYSRDDLYSGINAILYAIKNYFERSKSQSGYDTTGDIPFLCPLTNEEFQALEDNGWKTDIFV